MGSEVVGYSTELGEEATDKQLKDEYRKVYEQSAYESGHGGYTGTIAESSGCVIRRDLRFSDVDAAECDVDSFAEKWGPAVAVLVKTEYGYRFYFVGVFSS